MKRIVSLMLASVMTVTSTIPAMAQDSYADRRAQYEADQAAYDAQVRDYDAARAQYERDRAAYDRRYGDGAYERAYGPFRQPPPRNYVDASATVPQPPPPPPGPPPGAACAQARADAKSSRIGGTLLGAVIGGALGSNLARGNRNAGTLIGAGIGGAIGNKAGGDTQAGAIAAQCDHAGAYYTYDQTYPYREGAEWVPPGDHPYRYYTSQRCRLAPAQTDTGEYRYVRVCPDRDGRYRLAG